MSTFTERVADLIEAAGVPLQSVLSDTIRIEPLLDSGFIVKWTGAVILTAAETAGLVGPDQPGD